MSGKSVSQIARQIIVTYGGPVGPAGHSAFVYIAWASDDAGTGFSLTFDPDLDFIAILASETEIESPQASDFAGLWKEYRGQTGAMSDFKGLWSSVTTYQKSDGVLSSGGRGCISKVNDNLNHAPPSYPDTENDYWYVFAERGSITNHHSTHDTGGADAITALSAAVLTSGSLDGDRLPAPSSTKRGGVKATGTPSGLFLRDDDTWAQAGSSFWNDVPGTPTRVSDTQFTLTDAGNAHKYDLLLKKRVLLSWLDSGSYKSAMVISSSYSSDTVTVNIVGDALAAGFTDMRYAIMLCPWVRWIVPGYLGTGTDVAVTHTAECGMIPLAVDGKVKAAGTTGALTVDINDDGSSIMNGPTNDFSISSGNTETLNTQVYTRTEIAADSDITIDIDGTCTTPAKTLYLKLYWYPASWRYRT